MENECLTELLQFIETTSQFYDFTQVIPRVQILKIVRRYVSVLFQYPLLTGSTQHYYCECEKSVDFRASSALIYRHDRHYLHPDLYVSIDSCFQCGEQHMFTRVRDTYLQIGIAMNSFLQLEYWVIRPFVLYKVRSQFEDSLFEYLPIQDLVELVGDYLYVEPSSKRDTKRKLVFS